MDSKIRDIIFFTICITLGFCNIPKIFQISGSIGGPFSNKLALYPIIIGVVYTFYCQIKSGNVFVYPKKFLIYSFLYLSIIIISLINGFINYLEVVNIDSIYQLDLKYFDIFETILDKLNIKLNEQMRATTFIFIKYFKKIIWEYIFGFFLAYIIFCWYVHDWKRSLQILTKSILIFSICIIPYLIIELFYLCGSLTAKNILLKVNPLILDLYSNGVWPPILWNSGIRAIFNEPSYFGMFFAFAIPFLWYGYFNDTKKYNIYIIINSIITFFIFMTNARTAVGVLLFEIVFLILISYKFKLNWLKRNVIVFSSVMIFVVSSIFMSSFFVFENHSNVVNTESNNIVNHTNVINSVSNKFESNLYSLTDFNKRSNSARYPMMLANLNIGVDNPVLGVGPYMRDVSIP